MKKGETVSLKAVFDVTGEERGTAFFAVYDDKNVLVRVLSKELAAQGEESLFGRLFTAEADGSYYVKMFLWKDSQNMIPIDNALELR